MTSANFFDFPPPALSETCVLKMRKFEGFLDPFPSPTSVWTSYVNAPKGVDFIDASRPKASGGVKRLTSGTGTVELTVKRVLDEATGEVRVVPVHLIGVANKKIKSTAFEI